MRRFCLRHLFLIIAACMVVTSSYVLFDLLDIDGSDFKHLGQARGFEAVMPDCSEEIKSPAAHTPAPPPGPPRDLLLSTSHYNALTAFPGLPSTPSYRIIRTRNATHPESAPSGRGSDPAQRFA